MRKGSLAEARAAGAEEAGLLGEGGGVDDGCAHVNEAAMREAAKISFILEPQSTANDKSYGFLSRSYEEVT